MNALTDLIVKEGWRPVALAAGSALLFALLGLGLFAFVALLFAGLLVWNYRQPVRTVSHFEKGSITSPCDGKVAGIESEPDGSVTVAIETGYLDGSLLTMPFEGELSYGSVMRGARLGRKSALSERLNERGMLVFEDESGKSVRITHMLSYTPAPLVIDDVPKSKCRLRGERYGVLTQGLTLIHLPASTRVAVNPGESVYATETLLGYMR
jgi:hypothetical protein